MQLQKFLVFMWSYIALSLSWAFYGLWSRAYRFLFERKYTKRPTGLPWNETAIMRFFAGSEWTADKWYMLFDVISKPEKFFETRQSDCDEHAVFAASVMSHPAFLMSVQWYDPQAKFFSRFKGHNVALYFKNGKFHHISNTGQYGPFGRFYEAVYSVVPDGCIPCAFQCRTVQKFTDHKKDLRWISGGILNLKNSKKFRK